MKNFASFKESICKAYIIEEIASFCALYFEEDVQTRFTRVPRNDDGGEMDHMSHPSIFRYLGRPLGPKINNTHYLTTNEYLVVEVYILMNCYEMVPYIE